MELSLKSGLKQQCLDLGSGVSQVGVCDSEGFKV